ncbi:hypothetical protein niasHT_011912 [Heterodera trifolii]|uniref:Uncharacterized protein n=1 Tax=Heterodera trifolii TaxID=157864 RepID=A0ABD2KWB8_9BILA
MRQFHSSQLEEFGRNGAGQKRGKGGQKRGRGKGGGIDRPIDWDDGIAPKWTNCKLRRKNRSICPSFNWGDHLQVIFLYSSPLFAQNWRGHSLLKTENEKERKAAEEGQKDDNKIMRIHRRRGRGGDGEEFLLHSFALISFISHGMVGRRGRAEEEEEKEEEEEIEGRKRRKKKRGVGRRGTAAKCV